MGNIPAPKARPAADGATAFFKATHLGKSQRGRVVLQGGARTQSGAFGPQIVVPIKLGKKLFDWSFPQDGGNHVRLYRRFGKDAKKWKGPIQVGVKEFNGNHYVAVLDD